MTDLEKLRKGLECCIKLQHGEPVSCEVCPYNGGRMTCETMLTILTDAADVVEYLNEHRADCNARVLTLEELRTSSGHGWEEIRYSGDEEDVEGVALQECVWINGHIMLEDGCTADANEGIFPERYGMKYGCRVWQGMPTDEMRKETPWEEE